MNKRTRRNFTNQFKLKVVLEALKERYSLSELALKYKVHSNQISSWKASFLSNAEAAFGTKASIKQEDEEKQTEQLYAKIGKLEIECDFLKKNLKKLGIE